MKFLTMLNVSSTAAALLFALLAAENPPAAEPAGVDEIRIGYFGPDDPRDPEGGDLWCAASLAVEEANARGGYRGKPFRLIPGWSKNPWGTGVVEVTRMAYQDRVWAIIGGIDGPSTHLAEQVVAKARLVLISPAGSDKTVNLAHVPWMFSCSPGDQLLAPVLAKRLADSIGRERFVLLSTDGHDPHRFMVELRKCLSKRHLVPRFHFECKQQTDRAAELAQRIRQSKAAAVVIVAGAADSAKLVIALREAGFDGLLFGSGPMGRRQFLEEAREKAEGVIFPLLYLRPAESDRFAEVFRSRYQTMPDYAAAGAYDAVRLVVAAIRQAGLDRARIRHALADLSPWQGAAGTITWDSLGSNVRPVGLGTIRNGRVTPLSVASRRSPSAGTQP